MTDREPSDPGADQLGIPGMDPQGVIDALDALHVRSPGPRQAAARRIGAATRRLIDQLTATSAPPDALEEVAERLEAVVERLSEMQRGRMYEGYAESAVAGRPSAFFDWSPMLGLANPLAPPISVRVDGERVIASARFGPAYEGPPGCVHGGYVAAAFDEVLGLAQMIGGRPGMTGTLEVRYRAPTPLGVELNFAAQTVERRGRAITVEGDCRYNGTLTATARGVFVQVRSERFARLLAERDRWFQ
jgi:acyl-coenzyme A thioesterase PaaI-like protein